VRHPGLIQKFGGHAMAAGLSLARDDFDAFRTAFGAEIARRADPDMLTGVLLSDGALERADLCLETAQALGGGGPWGQGFPEPVFDGEFAVDGLRIVGEKHLRLRLRGAGGESAEAIAFGYVGGIHETSELRPGRSVRVAFRLEVNEYNGTRRPQLNCLQLRPA